MDKKNAVRVGIDLELRDTLLRGVLFVLWFVGSILNEPMENIDARMQENSLLKDYLLALREHHIADRAIIAHNVNLMLVVLSVEDQAGCRDWTCNRVDALCQENVGVGFRD